MWCGPTTVRGRTDDEERVASAHHQLVVGREAFGRLPRVPSVARACEAVTPRTSTPVARRGRKATGLTQSAGLPKGAVLPCSGMESAGFRMTDSRSQRPSPPTRRRSRDWLATGVMLVVLAGLLVPFAGTMATGGSGRHLIATWSDDATVSVVPGDQSLDPLSGSRGRRRPTRATSATRPARRTSRGPRRASRSPGQQSRGSGPSVRPAARRRCTSTASTSRP